MPMPNYDNTKKVMADAKKIARRLRETNCTQARLMAEYHCGYPVIMRAIRSQIPEEEWLQISKKKLGQGGVEGRFTPGHQTWNKNLKGIHLSPASEFKRGHLPHNAKKLGTITIHEDKTGQFRMIAVAGPTPVRHRWIPYARYLWEKENGPVPAGLFVIHEDGDRLNDNSSNFKLVDCNGNMMMMKKNRPGWKKKAIKSYKKTRRISRIKKMRALRKVQKEMEALQKRQAKRIQEIAFEIEQGKAAEAEKTSIYGPQFIQWECYGCGAEYHQEQIPDRCVKCGSHSFERTIYRKKAG
jgi:rubrerythrin